MHAVSRPLGEILLRAGVVTREQLQHALTVQRREGRRVGEVLVQLGFATEDDVAWALSTQLGLPYVHLRPDLVDPEALKLLPVELQRSLGVLPLLVTGEEVAVAVADPTDAGLLAQVERWTGLRASPVVALASNIRQVLEQVARAAPPHTNGELALRLALSHAAQKDATHVYVEPLPGGSVRFRYRSPGGVLSLDGPRIPEELLRQVAERHGQEGVLHLEVVLADRVMEAVLYVVPTRWGPALAGPLLPIPEDPLQDQVGLPEELWGSLEEGLAPGGAVVVVSPDFGLRRRLLTAAAARVAARWGGVVVLGRAGVGRPIPGVIETPTETILGWQGARPDSVVLDAGGRDLAGALLAAAWPGQKLVIGLGGYRTHHTRSLLAGSVLPPLRGVLAALALPSLCPCAIPCHGAPSGWPTADPPIRWFSARGCEACRHSGYSGQAVAYEWDPQSGARVPMETTARQLVESGRVPPQLLIPLLEG